MSDQLIQAQIEQITPLTNSILQLVLTPDTYVEYQAGQYLQMMSEGHLVSYSIANAPLGSHKYELHIRHSRDNPYSQPLLAEIKRQGAVKIRVPLGTCDLAHLDSKKPILFIAGGTGFAPIKAMIEQLLAEGESREFELFWGARSQSDLYLDDKVMQWQAHVPHFRYFSQLSLCSKETLASMVIDRHANDLRRWQVVLAGPFDMVYTIRDQLLHEGADPDDLFSDAFEAQL